MMNWRLILLALTQSILLASGQVSLKLALQKVPSFTWEWPVIKLYLLDYWFVFTGLFFAAASILWMYILKNFPLSSAYPLSSLAYVFGMIAAVLVFHESVSWEKWLGIAFILFGLFLMTKR